MAHVSDYTVFKQHIYCIFFWMGVGAGIEELVIFCGCRNCMILNVKKVMFLVLLSVLQWNSHPHFLVYILSEWKVTLNIFNIQKWHQMCKCRSLFKEILPWGKKLKPCQEGPYLLSSCFIKMFFKTITCPRQLLLSGPKSCRLVQVWQ